MATIPGNSRNIQYENGLHLIEGADINAMVNALNANPSISVSFASTVANLPITYDYLFGTSVTARGNQILINNATKLAQYFSPYGDIAAGPVRVNNELENYVQTYTTTANYNFTGTSLALTGTLDAGGVVAPTLYGNTGTFAGGNFGTMTMTQLGVGISTSTANVTVGQLFMATYNSIGVVTAVTGTSGTAVVNCSALLSQGSTVPTFVPFEFLPYYYGTSTSTTTAGATKINMVTPVGVTTNMTVSFYDNTGTAATNAKMNSQQNYAVSTAGTASVDITPALSESLSSGQGIFFTPPIKSGQLWSKNYVNPPGVNGASFLAIDAYIKMPSSTTYASGLQSIANASATGNYGAWPAFWMYSGTGGSFTDSSEVDVIEIYDNILRDSTMVDINVRIAPAGRGSGANAIVAVTSYLSNPPLWTYTAPNFTYNSATDYSAAYHHWQILMTPTMAYVYVDDVLLKKSQYIWTSSRPAQVILNLAIGSLLSGLGTNNLFPLASTNFPMVYSVQELKIWNV